MAEIKEEDIKQFLESLNLEKNKVVETILSLFSDKEASASMKLKELEITLGTYQVVLSGDFGFKVKTRRRKE